MGVGSLCVISARRREYAQDATRTARCSFFRDHDPHVWAEFVTLHFVDGKVNKSGTLTATRGHYVFARDDAATDLTLAAAKRTAMDMVRKGDSLFSRDGSPLRASTL